MTVASGEIGDAGLAAAVWDLEPLVDGGGADGARALLDDAARRAADFAARYGGRVLQLDAPEFAAAAQEWSGIRETMMRAFLYASLSHQWDLSDAAAGALYGLVAERRSEIEQKLRFFELEWGAGSEDAVERLLAEAVRRSSSRPIIFVGCTTPRASSSASPRSGSCPRRRRRAGLGGSGWPTS